MFIDTSQRSIRLAKRALCIAALALSTASCLGAEAPDEQPDEPTGSAVSAVSASDCTIDYYSTAARTQLVGSCSLPCGGLMSCWGRRTAYTRTFCTTCR